MAENCPTYGVQLFSHPLVQVKIIESPIDGFIHPVRNARNNSYK